MAARDFVLHNFSWKVLSLLLATLTWFTIKTAFEKDKSLEQSPVITVSTRSFPALNVTMMTSPANTNTFKINPKTAMVEVSGKANVLEALQEKEIEVFVNLTDIGDDKEMRKEIQVRAPRDIKVVTIKPLYVNVETVGGVSKPESK